MLPLIKESLKESLKYFVRINFQINIINHLCPSEPLLFLFSSTVQSQHKQFVFIHKSIKPKCQHWTNMHVQ